MMIASKPRIEEITIEQWKALSTDLIVEHHADVECRHADRPPSDIDWPAFERLESAGMTFCIGAFVDEKLVGYSLCFSPINSLHYTSRRLLQCDMFFVSKSWRGRQHGFPDTIGNMLRAEMMREAVDMNAKLCWRAKPGSSMAFWLERHGCSMEEIVYMEGA